MKLDPIRLEQEVQKEQLNIIDMVFTRLVRRRLTPKVTIECAKLETALKNLRFALHYMHEED